MLDENYWYPAFSQCRLYQLLIGIHFFLPWQHKQNPVCIPLLKNIQILHTLLYIFLAVAQQKGVLIFLSAFLNSRGYIGQKRVHKVRQNKANRMRFPCCKGYRNRIAGKFIALCNLQYFLPRLFRNPVVPGLVIQNNGNRGL